MRKWRQPPRHHHASVSLPMSRVCLVFMPVCPHGTPPHALPPAPAPAGSSDPWHTPRPAQPGPAGCAGACGDRQGGADELQAAQTKGCQQMRNTQLRARATTAGCGGAGAASMQSWCRQNLSIKKPARACTHVETNGLLGRHWGRTAGRGGSGSRLAAGQQPLAGRAHRDPAGPPGPT